MNWYQKTVKEALGEQQVNLAKGLTQQEATTRLKHFGHNLLARAKRETLLDIFARQFKSPLIYILIFAAMLVILLGQSTDALVIMAVITVNAIVGTVQEGKARNSLEKLKSLTRHKAIVRRDGQELLIPSEEVVPGDILILHEGDRITADARIIKAQSLKIDESVLTGEAYTVAKIPDTIAGKNITVGDQRNMAFAGTSIASGYCEAVVVETGTNSELGKISQELKETSDVPLPLARKVTKLTHLIAISVSIIASAVFAIGIWKGIELREIFGVVIGLSVSIVPEGLPVAVTIVLAQGVWRMAKSKAIVRQMAAVEAMSTADTLLVDKTGTITTGRMVIRKVYCDGKNFQVTGEGYNPEGRIISPDGKGLADLHKLLGLVYLSLKADVIKEENVGWKPAGDPTEAAIAVLCRKAGLAKSELSRQYKTIRSLPFDSQKRYIEAIFKKGPKRLRVYVGAPEFLAKDLHIDHGLIQKYHDLTNDGLRVVGVAVFQSDSEKVPDSALLAISEEIRENVATSVREAEKAGFKIAMLTGDFPNTARAIAKMVGIFKEKDTVLSGIEVGNLTDKNLARRIENVSVFARITAEHKLKIVNAFKQTGHIVAMTGDGVNDAPALQAADLGIGLGSGTQVAKDASDIVLVDNNFSTITTTIAQGRGIYLTLKKVILYLLSTSFGEVLVISTAILLGLPLPLVAVQIIWLNFVTDGFFVVALAQDPPEKGSMAKSRVFYSNLFDKLTATRSLIMALAMLMATLPVFYYFINLTSQTYARSIALLILSLTQWFNALNVRSQNQSIFKIPLTNNWFLIGAFLAVLILQIFAIQTPIGNKLLHTTPLAINDWILAATASSLIIILEELRKFYVRVRSTSS